MGTAKNADPARNSEALAELQMVKLNRGLERLRRQNRFYRVKLERLTLPLRSIDDLRALPFTLKDELLADQAENRPYGSNLTAPLSRYTRIHTTSGTSGRRLKWLDTEESWAWWLHCWSEIYCAAGVVPGDVVFAAFGFGPFIGFWSAFEAAHRLGARAVAGGGQSSIQRLDWIRESGATVLLSTPTYALRLAEVAHDEGIDLTATRVRLTLHAGEPGASVPATRTRIENAWGARCVDHAGLTEVGAWGFECGERSGLHVLETDFVAEILEPGGDHPVPAGENGELVLTNLGRWDMPVLRYRTGDIVEAPIARCPCGSVFQCLRRGVLGRADDMVQVRGNNIYPAALENLIREHPEVAEFEVELYRAREMWELEIRIEVSSASRSEAVRNRLARTLEIELGMRPSVHTVPRGSLPRYELKARRFKRRDTSHRP